MNHEQLDETPHPPLPRTLPTGAAAAKRKDGATGTGVVLKSEGGGRTPARGFSSGGRSGACICRARPSLPVLDADGDEVAFRRAAELAEEPESAAAPLHDFVQRLTERHPFQFQ